MKETKGVFVKRVFLDHQKLEGFDLILINAEPRFLVSYFKKSLQKPLCPMGKKEFFCEYCENYNPLAYTMCEIPHVWVEFFHPHEDDYVCRLCRPANEKELKLAGIKPR